MMMIGFTFDDLGYLTLFSGLRQATVAFVPYPFQLCTPVPNDGVGGTLAFACATCRGLHPTVLESLPVLIFAAAAGCDEDVVECAVCLNELEEGEKMRALPRCGHCFHVECIDMWFHSNSTCPLCRTAVEAAPPPPPIQVVLPKPAPTDDSGGLFLEDDASESSSASRDLRIEVPAREMEGELRLGLKSPGSRMLSLTSLLGRGSRVCCGRGTSTELERDPERREGAATVGNVVNLLSCF